ncbi:MAG: acyltransferase [Candidatus Woesearchaeota archaeon]|jgi:acetyltransferase-like isoleucine patch superfamily enzyme|nr:acyltransferase [Candidatus Woesearchaeota archaeon]MDP7457094.1 acyltransferase [Candidatus Woesearchaeota archaeon]
MVIHDTAEVSKEAKIGENSKIWHYCQVREGVELGENCILGKGVYIDFGVKIGRNCKIQNRSSIYHGTTIEEGVFIGPHVVVTNDKNPRAINLDGSLKSDDDWEERGVLIKKGASIGAGTVILPGVTVGRFSMIGAGAVVTKDIPDFGIAYGNPARVEGYSCYCGTKLEKKDEGYFCNKCNKGIDIK